MRLGEVNRIEPVLLTSVDEKLISCDTAEVSYEYVIPFELLLQVLRMRDWAYSMGFNMDLSRAYETERSIDDALSWVGV